MTIKLTDDQETGMRSAWGTWSGYATDPWRHDNIDLDDDYQKNCDEQDDSLLSDLVNGVIKRHPELSGKEEELKDWIREF